MKGPASGVDFLQLSVLAKRIWEEKLTFEALKKLICQFVHLVGKAISWLLSLIFSTGKEVDGDGDDVYESIKFHD